MRSGAWVRKRVWGLAVGTAVTLLTVAAFLAGLLAPLERSYLDYCFRHYNRIEADPRIVLIDINDLALQRIHRWPWPRKLQADLVNVLHECGARAILLDLVYAEPTPGRFEHPSLEPHHQSAASKEILGDLTPEDAIFDDTELADAIARAGNVYVAMFFPLSSPRYDPARTLDLARQVMDEDPDVTIAEFAGQIGDHDEGLTEEYFDQARMDRLLRSDFSLDGSDIAERLGMDSRRVEVLFGQVKNAAARFLMEKFLEANPHASVDDAIVQIMPDQPPETDTADRRDLIRAYDHVLASRFAFRHSVEGHALRGIVPNGSGLTLPIAPVSSAARRVGFVNFEKDPDGILRHVPPLANIDGRTVMQIAFSLVADELDIVPSFRAAGDGRTLVVRDRSGANEWRVPLDENGSMLLNWHIDQHDPTWESSFEHVPVARVIEVALNRRTIEENNQRIPLYLADAVKLQSEGVESVYLDFERMTRRRDELRRHLEDDQPAEGDIGAELQRLESAIEQIKRGARAYLVNMYDAIQGLEPKEDELELFREVRRLYPKVADEGYATQIERQNDAMQQRVNALLAELRQRVGGKLCFVGHTAAAQADMVNTPVFESMPGVMAHANLVNTFLNNRIPRVAAPANNVILILVTGLLITVLTSSKGPWITFLSVLALMGVSLAASTFVMLQYRYYLAAAIPPLATFVTWALITLYRQLTEERQRRSFARELARNTSPAIAARITEQLDDLDLAPRPAEVTCYFSDLQGFTSISERLGVEHTQIILNRYLGAMGEVLIEYKAFNKFMGDGIFAFFNAPIWPVERHAATGCEAALATLERLDWLKSTADESHAEQFQALRMRAGLHTGPVFVGYFGSENQTDYTCIGDTVNLAARLESANKAFGTQVIVSGACRSAVADSYEFRHLGSLQVLGKAQAVPVYELLGRAGQVTDVLRRYADMFAAAVAQFQTRKWDEARGSFQQCLTSRPHDAAALLYLTETDRLQIAPPADDWNRAIELLTK